MANPHESIYAIITFMSNQVCCVVKKGINCWFTKPFSLINTALYKNAKGFI